jgi:hypothetical protein
MTLRNKTASKSDYVGNPTEPLGHFRRYASHIRFL